MNDATFAFLGMLIGVSGAYWAFTYGVSRVAREKFLERMTALRDEVEDSVFFGELPDVESVQFLWAKTMIVTAHVDLVSYSDFEATRRSRGLVKGAPKTSYSGLTPPQRKLMHEYEERFVGAMATYIVNGSRLWFVLKLGRLLPSARAAKRAESPKALARQFDIALNKSKVRTDEGPRVSTDLLALC